MSTSTSQSPFDDARRRAVRRRPDGLPGIGCFRYFLVPHIVIGLALLFVLPASAYWAAFGRDHTAAVTALWRTTGSKQKTIHHAAYVYTPPGAAAPRKADAVVARETYDRLLATPEPARTLRVRAVGDADVWYEDVVDDDGGGPWGKVLGVGLFALIWCPITGIFFYLLFLAPRRVRKLYQRGASVPGRLVSKRAVRGSKSTAYFVRYAYTAPGGRPLERDMRTSAALWNAAEPPQDVRVLYHPRKPKRSVAYEFGPYTFDPAT